MEHFCFQDGGRFYSRQSGEIFIAPNPVPDGDAHEAELARRYFTVWAKGNNLAWRWETKDDPEFTKRIPFEPPRLFPPPLPHKEKLYITNPVHYLDRLVIWNWLHYMTNIGFQPNTVGDQQTNTIQAAFAEIVAVDHAGVGFLKNGRKYWAQLALGNSGIDVISDWGVPTPNDNSFFDEAMSAFRPEDYLP